MMYNILPRRYNRAKEGGRTFSVTTSVNILKSALYNQIKVGQFRDRIFTPFLDHNFKLCSNMYISFSLVFIP